MRENGTVLTEEYRPEGVYLEGIVKTMDLHPFYTVSGLRRIKRPAPPGKGRGPQFLYTKQKALLGGSAFCIEGWESINKFGVIKFSSFSILLLLYLSKEESEKMLNKNIYKRKNSLYN